MRQMLKKPVNRRTAALVVAVVLMMSLVIPAVASAASVPRSTLVMGTRYQATAKNFTVKGKVASKYRGKSMTIEVRKPGRSYWDQVGTARIGKTGNWAFTYKPKLGGKFYVRARYQNTKGLSRTAVLTVKKGPKTKSTILLASTTSTRDSGLFERLGPAFLAACPEYALKATFVGSGAAIALGGTGDADVLLTHSPAAEVDFMNGIVAGKASTFKGLNRYKVMYNDYVLVGPTANPAGVSSSGSAKAAFQSIATNGTSNFWSRNDKSGTNEKEKEIWASIGNPQLGKGWYKASGTMGMAQALAAANDATTGGYTLADRATWLNASSLGITKNLKIVNAGDAAFFNQYSVIEVKGARNKEGAQDFSNWIRSPQAQALIKTYGEYTYPGQIMFEPNAGSY
jgi:tungstate transport system substrate-binding protein